MLHISFPSLPTIPHRLCLSPPLSVCTVVNGDEGRGDPPTSTATDCPTTDSLCAPCLSFPSANPDSPPLLHVFHGFTRRIEERTRTRKEVSSLERRPCPRSPCGGVLLLFNKFSIRGLTRLRAGLKISFAPTEPNFALEGVVPSFGSRLL